MPLQPEQLHLNFYLGINFGKEKKAKDSAFEMFFVEEGVGVGPVYMETLCTFFSVCCECETSLQNAV